MRGNIGEYFWAQFWTEEPELFVPDVVRGMRNYFVGKYGVNTSWDSGVLSRQRHGLPEGWSEVTGHALSPPITHSLADAWPRSEHGFDEWYFFATPPTELSVNPFCNWYAFSLDQWEILRGTDNGFDLAEQLARLRPDIVVGEAHSIYVLGRDPAAIEAFCGLASEP